MAVGHQDFTQKKPDQLVYLELGVGNGGMLLTISEDGFRFRAVTPVRANTSMPFAFSLDGRNRLEGEGTVEWVEEDGKSGGMRFTEVSPEFHATLGAWLDSDVSHQAGREVTPAAATPLDTMEKIRQELRAGYPQRPAEVTPTAKASEQKPEPRIFPPTVAHRNVSEKSSPDKNLPGKNVAEESLPAQKPKPTIFARTPEKISESKEPSTASRLFPLSSARATTPEKPATESSAFLKPATEAKTPAVPRAPVIPPKPVESVPTKREVPYTAASSALFRTAPKPAETHVAVQIPAAEPLAAETFAAAHARPFIPPLEESFEQAWERARLTSPPDSPHLSRAAAGSIIAIALAIIFGALAYNFRQDIGSIFIQLGQSISGENRPAAPAAPAPVQENKPDTTPSAEANQTPSQPVPSQSATSQPQNAPAESGNVGKSSANSTNTNTKAARGAVTPGASGMKSGNAPSPVVNVPENSPPDVSADPAAKTGVTADSGIGQEEFAAAQDVLRGGNRQRDLSRAVALLWSSVKKGYVPAEVTLADLYRRGDGVEKNCDQARVLLVAASKKGSFEARQILEQIAERGCE